MGMPLAKINDIRLRQEVGRVLGVRSPDVTKLRDGALLIRTGTYSKSIAVSKVTSLPRIPRRRHPRCRRAPLPRPPWLTPLASPRLLTFNPTHPPISTWGTNTSRTPFQASLPSMFSLPDTLPPAQELPSSPHSYSAVALISPTPVPHPHGVSIVKVPIVPLRLTVRPT